MRILLTILVLGLALQGVPQNTAQELGNAVFKCFHSNKMEGINQYLPTAEIAIALAGVDSMPIPDSLIQQFKDAFPALVKLTKDECVKVRENLRKEGVVWKKTLLNESVNVQDTIIIPLMDTTIYMNNVHVLFAFKRRSFTLILKGVFKHEGKWYLGSKTIYAIENEN